MKLNPKSGKNAKYITGYFALIGSKEARDAGFLNEDGTSKELKKTVDAENKRIIIEINEERQ